MLRRARTLAFVTQKGGGGKTTPLVSTAVCALQAGRRIAIVDTDRQGSAYLWGQLRHGVVGAAPLHVIKSEARHLARTIATLRADGCDLIVVDTPGSDCAEVDMVLGIADLTLVPCKPRSIDLHAARVTYAKGCQLSPLCLYLLTMVPARGNRINEAREYLAKLNGRWLASMLGDRVDHEEAFKRGLGVTESNPKGAAAQEIAALWLEIESLL